MRLKKLIGLFTAGLMTVMMSVPAIAETTYTAVNGAADVCKFNKYLIMDAGDAVPAATFKFNIAPGNARAAALDDPDTPENEGEMEVLAGVVVTNPHTGKVTAPVISDVTFDTTATTNDVLQTGDVDVTRSAADRGATTGGVEFEAGEKYVKGEATVDFHDVTFTEPGIYRYIITEDTTSPVQGVMYDNDNDRVLDVYVIDVENATTHVHELEVAAYVMHTDDDKVVANADRGSADVAAAAAALIDKTDGFTNEMNCKDLVFAKEVAGNQASRDKYFKFTATVSCAEIKDDATFVVSLADDSKAETTDGNADATVVDTSATLAEYVGKANPTTVTGEQLKNGVNFYLQGGQSIAIRGIPSDSTYAITEEAEDYKSEAAVVIGYTDPTATTGTQTIGSIANAKTTDKNVIKTSFMNSRDGIIPTGVLLSVGPWVLLGAVLLGGVIFFAVRSKKKYDEE